MIRIALATAVVGGSLAAAACFFTCGAPSAEAGTAQEVADAADPHCTRAEAAAAGHDCDKEHCDRAHCDRSKHGATADAAPADGEDAPCPHAAPAAQTVLASTTKVLHVENATCGSCIVPIREQLTQLAGVAGIEGGEDFKDVIVTLKEGATVSDEQLIAAVKAAGYTAVLKPAAPKQS